MEKTAVLLIDCPDRKGLVARVAGMLYKRGANILHADQHEDHEQGLFFMRVEWSLAEGSAQDTSSSEAGKSHSGEIFDLEGFKREFAPLAEELAMRWQLYAGVGKPRVALFCSQYLHCMADLLHRWHTGELECEIPVIVSNHREVENLAAFYGIPFEHVAVSAATKAEAEARQIALVKNMTWS